MADQKIVSPDDYDGPKDFVHLHNHTVYSALDGVATPEQYAEECHKRGYIAMSATEHGHMASVPDMHIEFKRYGLKFIPGCFLPNQKIYTRNNVKEISQVEYGDYALTHLNNMKRIQNVQIRPYSGEMVRIKAWCVEDQFSTPEHPFLVREVTRNEVSKGIWEEDIKVDWVKAGDLFRSKDRSNKRRYRFYLCVPRLIGNGIDHIDISDKIFSNNSDHEVFYNNSNQIIKRVEYYKKGFKTTKEVGLPAKLKLTSELLWIMGLWLAEGSAGSCLEFSLSIDEYDFYQRIADYFAEFNINTTARPRNGDSESKQRDALDVTVYSSYFARLFINLFGQHFDNKRIPEYFIREFSSSQSEDLLEGILDGDSKRSDTSSYLVLNNESLVWQSRILMTKMEVPQYSAITELPYNNSDNLLYSIKRKRESGSFYYDYDEEFIYLPIYDISREHYDGDVYNIQVEGDNSYNTGVAVHNCEIYYNDYEPFRKAFAEKGGSMKVLREKQPHVAQRITRNRHLTILCKNDIGFHNLVKLTSEAYVFGSYMARPRIWFDKLCEYKEGLIILSGCMNGPPAHELRLDASNRELDEDQKIPDRVKGRDLTGIQYIKKFKKAFGDDYYIEVQQPCLHEIHDYYAFWKLVEYADDLKIPLVLANDAHYLRRKDFYLQKVMMAVGQGTTIDDPNMFHVNSDDQYMKTRPELWATFKNNRYSERVDDRKFEEMCDNTLRIADLCSGINPDTSLKIPDWSTVEKGQDADDELRKITAEALKKKGLHKVTKKYLVDGREVTYVEQAKIELDRFISKGFASYFLITRDMLKFGTEQGWPFGPRGSAGGSLVCFLIGIHSLDPLKWGLSFDRFMASSRGGYLLKVTME